MLKMRCVLYQFFSCLIVLLNLGHCSAYKDCEEPFSAASSVSQLPVNARMYFSLLSEAEDFNILSYVSNFFIQDTSIDTSVESIHFDESSHSTNLSLDALEQGGQLSSAASDSSVSQRATSVLSIVSEHADDDVGLFSVRDFPQSSQAHTDAFTQTSEEPIQEVRIQRMRRACVESYVFVMSHFWSVTLGLLSVGEIVCPLAALYFLYFSPSETEAQQDRNSKLSGAFITISFFCSTIKQSSKKIVALRNKLIRCCGIKIEEAPKRNKQQSDSDTD